MRFNDRGIALVACGLWLATAACAAGDVSQPPPGQASLMLSANVSSAVALVVVEVTAPDITTPLVFNIPISNGVASGAMTLPAGSNRTLTIRAFDANHVETHNGSVTLNIVGGTNPTISLVLTPLTGDAPITATLGTITIAVTPAPTTVAVGFTVTLSATISANGSVIPGTVTWATKNPGIATVSASGVVTGVGAGQTSIVATFGGAAGASLVTVTGP